MCAITGFKGRIVKDKNIWDLCDRAVDRGRDSFGIAMVKYGKMEVVKTTKQYSKDLNIIPSGSSIVISNHRAEPTTEYIKVKSEKDVHPFVIGKFAMVHNGTIANDKELAKKFKREDLIGRIDTAVLAELISDQCKNEQEAAEWIISNVKGSYSIALTFGIKVLLIANYKPLYMNFQEEGIYFSSLAKYLKFDGDFGSKDNIKKLPPYSYVILDEDQEVKPVSFWSKPNNKALVVCSGGLDSTVALTEAVNKFGKENVTLLHFKYHCNAEENEVKAVGDIAKHFGVELMYMPLDIFGGIITESPILNKEGQIQEYDSGVEFAYEWVPARNLVMMSMAVALSEAKGFGYIYLGNNLEESGAYPDNEMEFINKLQEIIPNAVKDGYALKIEQPVGNLMKHEIVLKGLELNAPLNLTWSCYKKGEKHCGICGPCRMRKVAFEMAGKDEVIEYEK